MPLGQCAHTDKRPGRARKDAGYEPFGAQWEQELDGKVVGEGEREPGGIRGATGIFCVSTSLRF